MRKFAISLFVGALALSSASAAEFEFLYAPPSNQETLPSKALYSTQYFVHSANDVPNQNGAIEMRKKDGSGLSIFLSPKDLCGAGMEGTVSIRRGSGVSIFNVDGSLDDVQTDCTVFYTNPKIRKVVTRLGRQAYVEVSGNRRFGLGVAGYRLVPFRTVATDKTNIAPGTVLYIDGLRGKSITLPDGSSAKHDGYVFAGDGGGLIKGKNHIDFFTGVSTANPAPSIITSAPSRTFTALIVSDATIIDGLRKLHQLK